MKAHFEKLVPSNQFYNDKNGLKQGEMNEINENLKLQPLVYNSQSPGSFKLVLEWKLVIKDKDVKFIILTLDGEQEFIMTLDGNEDRETLVNMISTSKMHLGNELDKMTENTVMANYQLRYVDFNETATNILALVRR